MIYLDNAATTLHRPPSVREAVICALENCGNPGRSGHRPSLAAAQCQLACRTRAGQLFGCSPEQVVLTPGCTQSLNMAIRTLVRPGDPVLISGFEHNAVTRPLHALKARITVAGRRLFDWEDTLTEFEASLRKGPKAAVFTCASNVFGYILPVRQLSSLCRQYRVPFILDAAQGAGSMALDFEALGADFMAVPGHKGLLGPAGTGLLLCARLPEPLLWGGTGTGSADPEMPDFLPDRGEAGTPNVPGFAGLAAGMAFVERMGPERIGRRQAEQAIRCGKELEKMGFTVFSGPHQGGILSFCGKTDPESLACRLADRGFAVRAGLHCAPLAHESAGTFPAGTVRISWGWDADSRQTGNLLLALGKETGRL